MAAVLAFQAAAAWAGSLTYDDFSSLSGLKRNGDAQKVGKLLRMTTDGEQVASVFSNTRVVNPNKAIHTRFRIHMHDGSSDPADGMAFVIHRDPDGKDALGGGGSAMGYGNKGLEDPIAPSLAVEFDIYDTVGVKDNVSVVRDGDQETPLARANINLYDKKLWVWIDYSPSKKKLKVYISRNKPKPATPKLKKNVNLNNVLEGGNAFAGFTAATGGESAQQDVLSWRLRNP